VRVLLDTNVLISGILFRGVPRTLLERAIRGEFDLVTSAALLDELEDVFVRSFELPPALARAVRTELETLAEVVAPADVPALSRDPDDDEVLAAAVVGQADAVVTGDQDLLVLETHQTIPIIRPADLVARLKPAEEDG
jgi:putative PIN family toxin of toxin-antitoxin system